MTARDRLREVVQSAPLPEMYRGLILGQLEGMTGSEEQLVTLARQCARAAAYVAGDLVEAVA